MDLASVRQVVGLVPTCNLGMVTPALRQLLALPLTVPIDVSAPLEYELVRLAPGEALAIARTRRIEIDQALDAVGEAMRLTRVARDDILPRLDLVLSYAELDPANLGENLGLGDGTYGISVVTTTDLNRTAERAALQQRRLGVAAAHRAVDATRDQVDRQATRPDGGSGSRAGAD